MKTCLLLAVSLALALGACEDEGLYGEMPDLRSTRELNDGLAFLSGRPGSIHHLRVATDGVEMKRLFSAQEGEIIDWMRIGPDPGSATSIFALIAPASERETNIEESLVRIEPEGGAKTRYAVGSLFGGLDFSPQGRWALLYHVDSDADQTGNLYNPNEVVLVDLSQPPSVDNPVTLSVDLGGRSFVDVMFVEPIEVEGVTRHLAIFVADGMVKILDLRRPGSGTVSVKLAADDDPRTIVPEQVVARAGDETRNPMLFVRTGGTPEIYAISLVPRPDGQPGLWASLNQYDGGFSPSDMELVQDGERPLLVVASSSGKQARIIDVDTADSGVLHLESRCGQVLARESAAGRELVLYGTGQPAWVHFLQVEGLAMEKGSNLSEKAVPTGISSAAQLDADRLMIFDYWGDLLLFDLEPRSMTKIAVGDGGGWQDARLHGDSLYLADSGTDRLAALDLESGHPESLVFDEPIDSFHIVDDSETGLVLHPGVTGRATIFPLAAPSRETAAMVDGFWLEGFVDDKEVP
ncbi:MAG: hypothetical protein R6V85_00520 [Polyangia bacterium]